MNSRLAATLLAIAVACSFFIPLIVPSHDSIWIDEGYNAAYGQIPTFTVLWNQLRQDPNSQGQMPLGMLAAWIGGQTLGTSEWALRAPNILWGLLTLLALWRVGRRVNCLWLPVVAAVHPFFWTYLNEGRPYALQIAASAWLLYALVVFYQEKGAGSRWAWVLALSSVATCGSIMLGVIAFACVLAVIVFTGFRYRWVPSRAAWLPLALAFLALSVLGIFYLASLLRGAGGARYWQPGLANVAFATFELAGASGFAPARHAIRDLAKEHQMLALALRVGLPLVALLSLQLFLGWGVGWRRMKSEDRYLFASCLGICTTTTAALILLSIIAAWPFWGRHLAPIFPFLVVVIAFSARGAMQGSKPGQFAFGLLLLLWLTSSLLVRYSPAHQRDDYRSATQYAREAASKGQRVWWVAAEIGARYYQLPLEPIASSGHVIDATNLSGDKVAPASAPDVIIMTKPDLCDIHGTARDYIGRHGYQVSRVLPAFTIYHKPE
jgi:hypothetical protein